MQPIFVGDVQGCADEFDELLDRARRAFGVDGFTLFIVGDLVNRGPHNLALLRTVADLVERDRAHLVLGNHELGLLLAAAGRRKLRALDTIGDVLDSPERGHWVDWLRRRPLVISGRLGRRDFVLVHAGVHPDWDLATLRLRARAIESRLGADDPKVCDALLAAERSDPDRDDLDRVTRCRGIDRATGRWMDAEPDDPADAWHRHWAARAHPYCVVYGHWAMQGLHVAPGLRGLDTGCVHHGRGRDGLLTAWIPDITAADPFAVPDDRFWQIPARRRYVPADGSPAW
jgi:bis(5'-nucleosyl)-tetraphosphatase (symmetrical)